VGGKLIFGRIHPSVSPLKGFWAPCHWGDANQTWTSERWGQSTSARVCLPLLDLCLFAPPSQQPTRPGVPEVPLRVAEGWRDESQLRGFAKPEKSWVFWGYGAGGRTTPSDTLRILLSWSFTWWIRAVGNDQLLQKAFGKASVTTSLDKQPWRSTVQEGQENCTSLPGRACCAQGITSASASVPAGPAPTAAWATRGAASLTNGCHSAAGETPGRCPHEHGLSSPFPTEQPGQGCAGLQCSRVSPVCARQHWFEVGSPFLGIPASAAVLTPIASLALRILGPALPQSFDSRFL